SLDSAGRHRVGRPLPGVSSPKSRSAETHASIGLRTFSQRSRLMDRRSPVQHGSAGDRFMRSRPIACDRSGSFGRPTLADAPPPPPADMRALLMVHDQAARRDLENLLVRRGWQLVPYDGSALEAGAAP